MSTRWNDWSGRRDMPQLDERECLKEESFRLDDLKSELIFLEWLQARMDVDIRG